MKMIAILLIVLLAASVALGQDGVRFNYQGRLLDGIGGAVPDGDYNMAFRIYSDSMGGTLLWEESHQAHLSGGLFDAQLGSINPCSLGALDPDQLYLETQVGDLPPLGSRIRMGSSPRSGSSQRVSGDIHTLPGLIRVFDPQPEPPGSACIVEVNSQNDFGVIRFFDPQPEPPGYAMKINIENGPDEGSFEFFAPQIGGAALVNRNPQIKMSCSSTKSDLLLQRAWGNDLSPNDSTGIYLRSDSLQSRIELFENSLRELSIGTSTQGGFANFFSAGSEYMGVEPTPWGGAIKMYNQSGDRSVEISSEGAARFLRDGSEYMGIEPVPWRNGGDLTMYDPTGGVTLLLASNGMASIGTGANTNILTIQQSSPTDPIADAWTTYSSRRWKTNIRPIEGALDKVMRLSGVTYDWIDGGKHDIGLIAEEVGQVIPEIVAYEDNGVDAKSVDYARLTALLIEAVKEQQKTIEAYRVSNDNLIQTISDLERRVSGLEKAPGN